MSAELPADRAALVAELERLEREYVRLAEGLSAGGWNRQVEPGKSWSVGQCVDHVARINRVYVVPLQRAAARAAQRGEPLRPNWLGRWLVKEMEPPPKRRLRAPAAAVPASSLEIGETLARFRAVQADIVAFVRETADRDLNRVRFRNPFLKGLPLFNVAAGLLVIAAHERRHLQQAQRVRAALSPERGAPAPA